MEVKGYDILIQTNSKNRIYITFGKGSCKNEVYLVIEHNNGGVMTTITRGLYDKFIKEVSKK